MYVLQKKLIFTPNPNAAILDPTLKLQAGQSGTPKNDEKRIIQCRVVAAVGCMCILASHVVYFNQLA
jgi:hypothetical protein